MSPPEIVTLDYAASPRARTEYGAGEDLLREGRVAALIVAGGQGSRLGIDGPKGAVEVSPVAHKTLFQLHAEKIRALARKYSRNIPLFIMTSRANNDETVLFFKEHDYFGLNAADVFFFVQGMLPSLTPDGRLIAARSGGLFMNPDGHGGTFSALRNNGCLEVMQQRGIEEIFYFQVDNPLVDVCDPLFLGLHHEKGAQMSSKIVRKRDFEEKVGVIAAVDGRTRVMEYSDMSDDMRYAADDDGEMIYWAGSIAIHVIRRDFIEKLTDGGLALPYHRAGKNIPTIDEGGNPVDVKGIKFETFIFDALPLSETSVTLEVGREDEFAPVKNKSGDDSLESSMEMQSERHRRWLEQAGIKVGAGVKVEISPLFALNAAELQQRAAELPAEITEDICLT